MATQDIQQGFGLRLRRLRERAGLSLGDLQAKLGDSLSRQAIHKYEKGKAMPSSANLIQLCDALQVEPDDLLAPSPREFQAVEFRRQAKFSAASQRRLRGALEIEFERLHALNEILGLRPKFKPPLQDFGTVATPADAERAAERLRKTWDLGHDAIQSLVGLLEANGIHVHLESQNLPFYGASGRSGDIPIVVLNTHPEQTDPVRLRFTAAHELGHLILSLKSGLSARTQEALCHRFAGALLMPAVKLKQELGGAHRTKLAYYELITLKERYGLSLAALYQRAEQVGIIGQAQLKSWYLQRNRAGWRQDEPGDYRANETPTLFRQHLLRALAEEAVTVSKAAALANQPISEIRRWLTPRKAHP